MNDNKKMLFMMLLIGIILFVAGIIFSKGDIKKIINLGFDFDVYNQNSIINRIDDFNLNTDLLYITAENSAKINMYQSDVENLKIKYNIDKYYVQYDELNNELSIKFKGNLFDKLNSFKYVPYLIIEIPKNYDKNLSLNIIDSLMDVKSLQLNNIQVDMNDSIFEINKSNINNMSLDMDSSVFNLKDSDLKNLELISSGSTVTTKRVKVNEIEINANNISSSLSSLYFDKLRLNLDNSVLRIKLDNNMPKDLKFNSLKNLMLYGNNINEIGKYTYKFNHENHEVYIQFNETSIIAIQ